jgi:DNA replication and repair protein RecF
VEALKRTLSEAQDPSFPQALLTLEADGSQADSLHSIEAYRQRLARGRELDRAAGRTLFGPHTVDVHVQHVEKAMPAVMCSTGEQKALLVGIILAHARLVASTVGLAPTLLLDEVLAHLDVQRRARLIEQLQALGASVWMTGTDPELFAAMQGFGTWVEVAEGRLNVGRTSWS